MIVCVNHNIYSRMDQDEYIPPGQQQLRPNAVVIPKKLMTAEQYTALQAQNRKFAIDNTLNTHLELYKNWAIKQIDKPRGKQVSVQIAKNRNVPNSIIMQEISRVVPQTQLTFNQNNNKWQGPLVERQVNKHKAMQRATAKRNANNSIRASQLTPTNDIMNQIPTLIKQIVSASKQLGVNGFGSIRKGGSMLYAGRWVDGKTGRIRMLPKASTKFINPTSLPQKIAFAQARLLNKWNQYVAQTQKYQKLEGKDAQQYQIDKKQSIKQKLYNTGSYKDVQQMKRFINRLRKIVIRTITNSYPAKNVTRIAMRYLMDLDIGEVKSLFLSTDTKQGYTTLLSLWDQFIQASLQEFNAQSVADQRNLSKNPAARKQIARFRNALISFSYDNIKRLMPTIRNAFKAQTLPSKQVQQVNLRDVVTKVTKMSDQLDRINTVASRQVVARSQYEAPIKQLQKLSSQPLKAAFAGYQVPQKPTYQPLYKVSGNERYKAIANPKAYQKIIKQQQNERRNQNNRAVNRNNQSRNIRQIEDRYETRSRANFNQGFQGFQPPQVSQLSNMNQGFQPSQQSNMNQGSQQSNMNQGFQPTQNNRQGQALMGMLQAMQAMQEQGPEYVEGQEDGQTNEMSQFLDRSVNLLDGSINQNNQSNINNRSNLNNQSNDRSNPNNQSNNRSNISRDRSREQERRQRERSREIQREQAVQNFKNRRNDSSITESEQMAAAQRVMGDLLA